MARQQDNNVFMLSALDEDILTTLSWRGSYGLELLEIINHARSNQGMSDLSPGSLYPALKRLEEQGLIEGEWGESIKETRVKYYRISNTGNLSLEKTKKYRNELACRDFKEEGK
jgi:DNA-binding PadR family transcriptional regulator